MPVRCFQVDNTINDLLRVNLMSPAAKNERKRKQVQWEDIQPMVVQVRAWDFLLVECHCYSERVGGA